MFLGKKPVRIRMPRCAALTSNTPLQCARHIALKTARLSDEGSPLEGMHAAAPAHANARYASVRHSPLLCAEIQCGNSVRTLRTDKCAALATSVRTSMPRCTALMRQARIQRGSLFTHSNATAFQCNTRRISSRTSGATIQCEIEALRNVLRVRVPEQWALNSVRRLCTEKKQTHRIKHKN